MMFLVECLLLCHLVCCPCLIRAALYYHVEGALTIKVNIFILDSVTAAVDSSLSFCDRSTSEWPIVSEGLQREHGQE